MFACANASSLRAFKPCAVRDDDVVFARARRRGRARGRASRARGGDRDGVLGQGFDGARVWVASRAGEAARSRAGVGDWEVEICSTRVARERASSAVDGTSGGGCDGFEGVGQ